MGHDHAHVGHTHGAATPGRLGRMIAAAALLAAFVGLEVGVGLAIGSLSLLADAGHMVTDLLALGMGIAALGLAARGSRTRSRTFGWHRAEVLTAVVNAALLLGVGAYILIEAIDRIGARPDVAAIPLIATAAAGLAANVVVMLLLRRDAEDSLAVRGAYLEVLADAVSSVGVLIAGLVTLTTGWPYADLVAAVLIAVWVVPRAVRLALDALRILVQQGPRHIDVAAVHAGIAGVPGVDDVHDLHIWTLTTGMDVATVHVTSEADPARTLAAVRAVLHGHGLEHATVQIESAAQAAGCDEVTW